MPPAAEQPLPAEPCHSRRLEQSLSLLLLRAGVGSGLECPVLHSERVWAHVVFVCLHLPSLGPCFSACPASALCTEHLLPQYLVPLVTLLYTLPCLQMYVYVYRERYWSCVSGAPWACQGPSTGGRCKKCHVLLSGWRFPNKHFLWIVVFLAHLSLQPCIPCPQATSSTGCHRHQLVPWERP